MSVRLYHMGVGEPPFEFVYSSTRYVIPPPDQHWKEIKEKYLVGTFPNGKEHWAERSKWVVDEETTARKKRIINFLDLTDDQYAYVRSAQFGWVDYLKTSKQLDKEMSQQYDVTLAKHEADLADLKKRNEEQLAIVAKEHAAKVASVVQKKPV